MSVDPELYKQIGSVSAKIDSMQADITEIKRAIVPNGPARVAVVETKVSGVVRSLWMAAVILAALAGERALQLINALK